MSIVPYTKAQRKWASYKLDAIVTADKLRTAGQRYEGRALRMSHCSDQLIYHYCTECGTLKIARTNLCRDRLCPICSWRLATQRAGQMMTTMSYLLAQRPALRAAMLTLTVRNVSAPHLGATIGAMTKAWTQLIKRRNVARWVDGYARSIEITRGKGGTYHPHIHAIIIWADGYDKHIKQREWAQMWSECLGLSYTPIVDIRSAYAQAENHNVCANDDTARAETWEKLLSATIEACKYALKADVTKHVPAHELSYLAESLKDKMLISYGGCIRAARAATGITARGDSPTSIEDTSLECPKCGSAELVQLLYEWAAGEYLLAPFQPFPS